MANILPFTTGATTVSKDTERTLSDDVRQVILNWTRSKAYHQDNLDLSIKAWRYYYAKNAEKGYGQYPKAVVDKLIQQGRQILQYNFIQPIVDALGGALLQMQFDPQFIPVNSEITSLTEAIKQAMYSDKEIMDWPATWFDVVIGGLIHEGVCKVVISDKFDDLGNIGVETCLPGSTFFDPAWKTWRSSDCRRVHHESWHTPDQLIKIYPDKEDLIMFHAKQIKRDGIDFGANTGVVPYQTGENKWGSALRVIEEYDVITKIVNTSFHIMPDGNDLAIPDTIDDMDKVGWLNENLPGWQPDYVYDKPKSEKICIVRSVCEELLSKEMLEERPTEVQIQATPFKSWSAARFNGDPKGIVPNIMDPQEAINNWESMITHKLQIEGGGGAQFGDPTEFETLEEFKQFVGNRNNPARIFKVRPGGLRDGVPIKPVVTIQFPAEAYQHLNHIISVILPHVSKVTPATMGQTEPGQQNMSGVLYDSLKTQSQAQAYTLNYGLRMFHNDFYESYLLQAANQYSNELQERVFTIESGKKKITLNEQVEFEDGTVGIKNDVSQLKSIRHKVIISDKPAGPAQQMEDIDTLTRLISAFGTNPNKAVTINRLQSKITDKLPQLSQEDKEELKIISDKETELDMMTLEVKILQASIARKQAEDQLNQMMNPQAALPAPGITGAPLSLGAPGPSPEMPTIAPQGAPVESITPIAAQPQGVPNG